MRPGIDLMSVERMGTLLERSPRFLERYFTEREQIYIGNGPMKAQRAAAAFAVKEATAKAMGTGIAGFSFRDIELTHRESGEPIVILHGKARQMFCDKGYREISCSISHTDDIAAAIVLIEGGGE